MICAARAIFTQFYQANDNEKNLSARQKRLSPQANAAATPISNTACNSN